MPLVDQIIGAESGGNPSAKNPRSSATGLGQFIGSTWLDMIGRYHPELAGLAKDQQLALRNDPALSREMTTRYADENGAKLQAAGFEASPGNTYLAHFAGPAGATSVLSADPSTPVSQVLPAASVAANPFLSGMTAGDLTNWAARKVGGSSPAMAMPSGSPASGTFGLTGVESSAAAAPRMTVPDAKPDDSLDIARLLQSMTTLQAAQQPAAQPAAQPQTPAPQQRPAAPFDPAAFYALLGRRR